MSPDHNNVEAVIMYRQTSIRIWYWFVKGCKCWAKVVVSYGTYAPSSTVGRWYTRRPPVYMQPMNPHTTKFIRPRGCPPDSARGRHWNRKAN